MSLDNNKCKKERGNDKDIEECIKIGNMGQVIIDDASKNGEIYFGNQKLSGDAIKCATEHCNTSKIGEIYVLLAQEGNGYLLAYNQDITYIFRNGGDALSSLDQLDNYVAIKSFNWGNFNIQKKLDEDIAFILRSNDGDVLSCLGIKTYCIAASFSGGKTFKAALDQTAKFIGDSIGINKVVVALGSKSTERKLLENSVSEHSLELNQIKLGDTIDLSQLDLSGLRIERDTGNSTIYFATGEKIEVRMNPDYPLTITDPDQSGIIATKIDPNLYYEHSPTPQPDSGSNWHWYDTLGVVAGSTVGTGVLAALGRFTYIKYCQNGGAPLIANLETSLLDGSMEV